MPAQSFHPYLWYREVIAMDYFIRMHVCAYLYLSMYSLYFPLAISHLITRRARTDRPSKGRTDALDCILVIQHHHNFHFSHKNSHQKQRKKIQSKKVTSAVNNLHSLSIHPTSQPTNLPTIHPP